MKTMGLDLSLTSTGVSIGGATASIQSKQKGVDRLMEVRDSVLAAARDAGVEVVAVEGYSYASRNSQAHSLGELGGVIRVALREEGIPYIVIPPTSRAKFATGKGNAGKSEVVSAVSAMTGIVWSGGDGEDRCDAWVLEQMLLVKLNQSSYAWTKQQLEALDKVEWTGLPDV